MSENKQQESLYSEDLFDAEMQMIDDELNDLDNLYKEIKVHFDTIKNSQSRGSLTFVKDQTNNLISIKTAKLNYIKQKADLKKNLTDFAFKEKQTSKDAEGGIDSISNEVYKKILSEFNYSPDKENINYDDDIEQLLDNDLDEEDIGNIVENIISVEDVNVDYTNEEENTTEIENEVILTNLEEEQEEESNTIIAVNLDTLTFYELDKNTLEEVEELGYIEKIIDTTDIDDEEYAIGESGTIYLTITSDEDD